MASEELAQQQNWPVLAHPVDAETACRGLCERRRPVNGAYLCRGAYAETQSPEAQDFDIYEIHEAFSGQVLCTLKAWKMRPIAKSSDGIRRFGSIDQNKLNTRRQRSVISQSLLQLPALQYRLRKRLKYCNNAAQRPGVDFLTCTRRRHGRSTAILER